MSHRRPGPLPNRWLHCPRKSETVIANKFLAFKTPLSEKFESQMAIDCTFTPDMLFQVMKNYKIRIGLWIDLTNTSRFYNKKDVEANGCRYVKLQCRGHGETPSADQTKSFIEIVEDFGNDNPLGIVGVHCTHGFNRTGFLIVSYMVEMQDCSVEAALAAFAQARPPGIYKDDYIKELFRRYADEEDATPAPKMPDWCIEYDDSTGNNSMPDTEDVEDELDEGDGSTQKRSLEEGESSTADQGEPKKKKRKEFIKKNATFMAGVMGVELVTDLTKLAELQNKIQEMCGWKGNGFPGCQPVSMDIRNLEFLQKKPYMVSWKADGTRYMLLINREDEVYFFDRDNSCFKVSGVSFPHRKDLKRHLTNTLLDGEMVIDKVGGLSRPRYLVYDIIKFEDQDLFQNKFTTRLQCIETEIIWPRTEAMKQGSIKQHREPFSVRQKSFWDLTQAAALLGPKFAKALSHEPDGLIFQPSKEPYVPGCCKEVLKWKPLELNSVDFKLKIAVEEGEGILRKKIGLLFVGGKIDAPFGTIKFSRQLKDLDGKIIECKFENNKWVFMRERTDKSFPNSFNTASSVCDSIRFPITTEALLEFIDKKRYKEPMRPEGRMLPPKDQMLPPKAKRQ